MTRTFVFRVGYIIIIIIYFFNIKLKLKLGHIVYGPKHVRWRIKEIDVWDGLITHPFGPDGFEFFFFGIFNLPKTNKTQYNEMRKQIFCPVAVVFP